jgi:hypothetical protein
VTLNIPTATRFSSAGVGGLPYFQYQLFQPISLGHLKKTFGINSQSPFPLDMIKRMMFLRVSLFSPTRFGV